MDGGALDVVAQETPRCFTDARTQFRDEPGAARVHAAPAVRDACGNYMPLGSVSSAVGGCRGGVSFLHGVNLFGPRCRNVASRMLGRPNVSMTSRARPSPNPP